MSDSTVPPSRNPKRQRQKEGAQARRAAELAALRRQQRNRRVIRVALIAVVAVAILGLVSFLGDDDDDPVATEETSSTTVAGESTTTSTVAPIPATPLTCEPPSGENTNMDSKPVIEVADAPATELTCQDLVVGTGEEVLNTNDVVQVHYVGVQQSNGQQFDSSWERDEPATFGLDGVIAGWTEGIPGMKVGGRRLLTIPEDKAYQGGDPSGTLVFVVDLLAVNP